MNTGEPRSPTLSSSFTHDGYTSDFIGVPLSGAEPHAFLTRPSPTRKIVPLSGGDEKENEEREREGGNAPSSSTYRIFFLPNDRISFLVLLLLLLSSGTQSFYATVVSLFLNIDAACGPLEVTRYWLCITTLSLAISSTIRLPGSSESSPFFFPLLPWRHMFLQCSGRRLMIGSLLLSALIGIVLGVFPFYDYRGGEFFLLFLSLLSQVCIALQNSILNQYVLRQGGAGGNSALTMASRSLSPSPSSASASTPASSTPPSLSPSAALAQAMVWRSVGTLFAAIFQAYLFLFFFSVSQILQFTAVLFVVMIPFVWMLPPLSPLLPCKKEDAFRAIISSSSSSACCPSRFGREGAAEKEEKTLQLSLLMPRRPFYRLLRGRKGISHHPPLHPRPHNSDRDLHASALPGNTSPVHATNASSFLDSNDKKMLSFEVTLCVLFLFTMFPESSAVYYHYLFSYQLATWYYAALTAVGFLGSAVGSFLFSKVLEYMSLPYRDEKTAGQSSFSSFGAKGNPSVFPFPYGAGKLQQQRSIKRFVLFLSIGVSSFILSHSFNLIMVHFFSAEAFRQATREHGFPSYAFWWYIAGASFAMGVFARLSFLPILCIAAESPPPPAYRETANEVLGFVTSAGGAISALLTYGVVLLLLHASPDRSLEDLLAWTAIICGACKLLCIPVIVHKRLHQVIFPLPEYGEELNTLLEHHCDSPHGVSGSPVSSVSSKDGICSFRQHGREDDFFSVAPSVSSPSPPFSLPVRETINEVDPLLHVEENGCPCARYSPTQGSIREERENFGSTACFPEETTPDVEVCNNEVRWGDFVFDVPKHYNMCTHLDKENRE